MSILLNNVHPNTVIYSLDLRNNVIANCTNAKQDVNVITYSDGNVMRLNGNTTTYNALGDIVIPSSVLSELRGAWVNLEVYARGTSSNNWCHLITNDGISDTTYSISFNNANLNTTTFTRFAFYPGPNNTKSEYAYIPENIVSARISFGVGLVDAYVEFSNIVLSVYSKKEDYVVVDSSNPPRIHDIPYRGVNIEGDFTLKYISDLKQYNANLVRFNIGYSTYSDYIKTLDINDNVEFDTWFSYKIGKLDILLKYAKECGFKIMIDFHTPQGGMSNVSFLVQSPELLNRFYEQWHYIANRYKNNPSIYAFNIINEPTETYISSTYKPKQWDIQIEVAKIIRQYDIITPISFEFDIRKITSGTHPAPDRTFPVDSALGPVVYQIHIYDPSGYVFQTGTSLTYNSSIVNGSVLNKTQLRTYLETARKFQLVYRVPIVVGEFSVNRWAPGGATYLNDLISLFEEYEWDWTYFSLSYLDKSLSLEYDNLPISPATLSVSNSDRKDILISNMAANINPYSNEERFPINPSNISAKITQNGNLYISIDRSNCELIRYVVNYKKITDSTYATIYSTSDNFNIPGVDTGIQYDVNIKVENAYGVSTGLDVIAEYSPTYVNQITTSVQRRAYGLRLINTTYSGPLIKVQRSSDNAELDIYANAYGVLDMLAITDFISAGDGAVATLYDQSGNGLHLIQPTYINMPKIAVSGNILTMGANNTPYISFNGINSYLGDNNPSMYSAASYSLLISGGNTSDPTATGAFIGESGNTAYHYPLFVNSTKFQYTKSYYKNDASVTTQIPTNYTLFKNSHKCMSYKDDLGRVSCKMIESLEFIDRDYTENFSDLFNAGYVNVKPVAPYSIVRFTIGCLRRSGNDNFVKFNLQEYVQFDSAVEDVELNQIIHSMCSIYH